MRIPEISVVMPVFNATATLDATIASILEQTFEWFELIVIDDGSSDDSLRRLLGHAGRDERIRLVSRDNGGVSSARNLGVELAKAPLIAFIDADDIWDRRKLACHVAAHRDDPCVAATYARIAFIEQNASSIARAKTVSTLCPHQLKLADVLGENPVCTASNMVIRRDWFLNAGGFDVALSFAEDQEFIAQIIARGGRVEGIDDVLTGYRFSPDGLSVNFDRMYEGWRLVAERYYEGPILTSLDALYCRYLARRVLRSGGNPLNVIRYVARGLQLDASAFLRERRRGFSTIFGAIAAPFMPAPVRRWVFA